MAGGGKEEVWSARRRCLLRSGVLRSLSETLSLSLYSLLVLLRPLALFSTLSRPPRLSLLRHGLRPEAGLSNVQHRLCSDRRRRRLSHVTYIRKRPKTARDPLERR